MNQILCSKDFEDNSTIKSKNKNTDKKNSKFKKTSFFKFQFILCTIIALSFSVYYGYSLYDNNKKENISKKLVDNFNITSLYADNNYTSTRISGENTYQAEENKFNVVGLIEINSININYPIISTFNYDLLKISPCRFFGPMPNEVGNLCIAGHNYNSYKFFSKLKDLKIGDIINIYDLSGNKLAYSVYDSFETNYDDLNCINQDTNGKREITLITCNNIKNRRRVIKATEKV